MPGAAPAAPRVDSIADPLVERYLEHVRVEKRLAERKEKALSIL